MSESGKFGEVSCIRGLKEWKNFHMQKGQEREQQVREESEAEARMWGMEEMKAGRV